MIAVLSFILVNYKYIINFTFKPVSAMIGSQAEGGTTMADLSVAKTHHPIPRWLAGQPAIARGGWDR
ncbi:hypothetical protein FD733_00650 [Pantoea sp. Eser]|nr:hypothetical protein [Pantoea sp. Eser]